MMYDFKIEEYATTGRKNTHINQWGLPQPKLFFERNDSMFEQTPDILTFKECQELLNIGKNTLLDLLHDEEIEGFKIGSRWKIPKAAVLEYIYHKY